MQKYCNFIIFIFSSNLTLLTLHQSIQCILMNSAKSDVESDSVFKGLTL